MNLSLNGETLIKHFEGLRLVPYLCTSGVVTVGWGHTKTAKIGKKITTVKAQELFNSDVKVFVDGVNSLLKVDVSQNLFDAMVSLSFNIGLGNFSKSTLLKLVNNKKPWLEIAPQFRRWVFSAGVRSQGLARRREAEILLAQGMPWKNPTTATDTQERNEVRAVAFAGVEAEWVRHEKEANNPIKNTTVLGSSVASGLAIVQGAVTYANSNPEAVATSVKDTATQIQEYTPYAPWIAPSISLLMVVSLGLVIWSRVKKIIESKY